MAYSKEELESFIKEDEASLRNYDDRMAELRKRVKEATDEVRRLEETPGLGEETNGSRTFEEIVELIEDRLGIHRESNRGGKE